MYRRFAILLGTVIGLIALAVVPADAKPAPTPKPRILKACVNEGPTSNAACVWDARHMDNGKGRSFLILPGSATRHGGLIVRLRHYEAHHMVNRKVYPCSEGSDTPTPCAWDARHMGNGRGDSFIALPMRPKDLDPRIVYVKHNAAHNMLRWSK